jgi:hypothetical protein
MIQESSHVEFSFGLSGAPGAVLSTIHAGDMKREEGAVSNPNRRRLYDRLGIDPGQVLSLPLGHTRRVVVLETARREGAGMLRNRLRADLEAQGPADGIILRPLTLQPVNAGTHEDDAPPCTLLAVTVADCMPIWLWDTDSGAYGLLHSGWKGTGILAVAVDAMARQFGARPSRIAAILGPSIGSCCYEVPDERAAIYEKEFGSETVLKLARPDGTLSCRLDLGAANLRLARRLGLGTVIDARRCTACSSDLGSFRRQGPASFTRMLALCGYLPGRADTFTELSGNDIIDNNTTRGADPGRVLPQGIA